MPQNRQLVVMNEFHSDASYLIKKLCVGMLCDALKTQIYLHYNASLFPHLTWTPLLQHKRTEEKMTPVFHRRKANSKIPRRRLPLAPYIFEIVTLLARVTFCCSKTLLSEEAAVHSREKFHARKDVLKNVLLPDGFKDTLPQINKWSCRKVLRDVYQKNPLKFSKVSIPASKRMPFRGRFAEVQNRATCTDDFFPTLGPWRILSFSLCAIRSTSLVIAYDGLSIDAVFAVVLATPLASPLTGRDTFISTWPFFCN